MAGALAAVAFLPTAIPLIWQIIRAEERLGLRHTTAAALSVQSAIRRGAEPTEELRRENVVEALYVRPEGTDAVVLGTALPAELIAERVMPSVS